MKKIKPLLTSIFLLLAVSGNSQDGNKAYWKSASEFIFSLGDVNAYGFSDSVNIDVTPVVRFSGFFNFQEQFHFDFSKNAGFYTGIGVRNVGMINKLNDSVKVKQRVYSLGIPLAFKVGKIPGGFYFTIGGEGEFFFHYKQKVFYDDDKYKKSEWLSDRVNLFQPSAFIDFTSKRGSYIRLKYYFLDFLTEDKQHIRKVQGGDYPFHPTQSRLFYIAIGSTIRHIANDRSKKPPVRNTHSAWNGY